MKTMKYYLLLCSVLVMTSFAGFASADEVVYRGYRDGILKSPSAGVSNENVAKLHACLRYGYSDVGGDWSTCYYDKCTSSTINPACSTGTCQSFCTSNFN